MNAGIKSGRSALHHLHPKKKEKHASPSSALEALPLEAAQPHPFQSFMSIHPMSSDSSSIRHFFHNRSLFVTGASGFIG
jgi:hypothetical protein